MADEEKKKKPAKSTKTSSKSREVEADAAPVDAVYPRMRTMYKEVVTAKLKEQFKYKSTMQVPRLQKVVLNCGLGSKATQNIKIIDQAMKDVAAITGQRPVAPKSKMAISNFKLRAGLPIGVMVTLRGDRMYEFIDRLVSVALPRIRDFRGISDRGFDGRGNYTLGLKDQLLFPEIQFDSVDSTFGMNLTFVTSAKTDDEGRALLTHFGFPFRKRQPTKQEA